MTIIFDENVPWPLHQYFNDYSVTSVQKENWAGIQNGALIEKIDTLFTVFILADKNLRYQQNLKKRTISIFELPTNRWPLLQQIAPRIVSAVQDARPGSYTVLEL